MTAKKRPHGSGQREGSQDFPTFEPSEFAQYGKRNVEFMSRAALVCFKGATQMNKEWAVFLNHRWKKDFEAAQAAMALKNSHDALGAQAGFIEDAFRDYAEESSRVFSIAAEVARDVLKPVDG